jgi:hypothetical protein
MPLVTMVHSIRHPAGINTPPKVPVMVSHVWKKCVAVAFTKLRVSLRESQMVNGEFERYSHALPGGDRSGGQLSSWHPCKSMLRVCLGKLRRCNKVCTLIIAKC